MMTHHDYRGHVFQITYQPREPIYLVNFVDIPDIISNGSTLSQAFVNACEALDLHLESAQKLGLAMPLPKHRLVLNPACS